MKKLIFLLLICYKYNYTQIVYINVNGKYIQALTKEGNKWEIQKDYYKNSLLRYDPFYINNEGEIFDASEMKFGWYVGFDFYTMNGWVVENNIKKYYKHKELIYNESQIVFQFCNGLKSWIIPNKKSHYDVMIEEKINGEKKLLFSLKLENLEMDKITALAIYRMIKEMGNDKVSCGYGEHDDRDILSFETKAEKMKRIEKENIENEKRYNERIEKERKIKDSIAMDEIRKEKQREIEFNEKMKSIKYAPLSITETGLVGNWEFISEPIDTDPTSNKYKIIENFKIYKDRTYEYYSKEYVGRLHTNLYGYRYTINKEYNEKGVWELKDNNLIEFIIE
jgi:hypothetical protein